MSIKTKIYTSKDVAKLAGVSQSTVSRVFANTIKVSDIRRNKIFEAAERLNYKPNALARSLITRQSKLIGIVMRTIRNPFYSAVLEIFHSRFTPLGYNLIFINSENEIVAEEEIIKLLEYNVAGIIVSDAVLSKKAMQNIKRNNIALVHFNRYIEGMKSNAVFCNNYLAAKEIASYLIRLKHNYFAFISGPLQTSITQDRLRGFKEILEFGKNRKLIFESGEDSYKSGFILCQKILNINKKIDCLLGGNDLIALGIMDGAKQMGYKVPDNISVIGFDNIRMTEWDSYNLTTWEQPLEEMITQTVNMLLNEINGNQNNYHHIMMNGQLIIRNTVKNLN